MDKSIITGMYPDTWCRQALFLAFKSQFWCLNCSKWSTSLVNPLQPSSIPTRLCHANCIQHRFMGMFALLPDLHNYFGETAAKTMPESLSNKKQQMLRLIGGKNMLPLHLYMCLNHNHKACLHPIAWKGRRMWCVNPSVIAEACCKLILTCVHGSLSYVNNTPSLCKPSLLLSM